MQNCLTIKFILVALCSTSILLVGPSADAQLKKKADKTVTPAESKAQKGRKPQTSNGIHVMPMDPNFPADELEKDGYQTHTFDRNTDFAEPETISDTSLRDEHLLLAGLGPFVQDWDHFERDMLYLRALNYPPSKLRSKYPKFPAKSLQKLQSLIHSGAKR